VVPLLIPQKRRRQGRRMHASMRRRIHLIPQKRRRPGMLARIYIHTCINISHKSFSRFKGGLKSVCDHFYDVITREKKFIKKSHVKVLEK